jgi:hypothetical protein
MENRINLYCATPHSRGAMSRVLESPAEESKSSSLVQLEITQ